MTTYIVAVKRECRAQAGADWAEALRDVPGVEADVPGGARRARVRATDDGVRRLRERVGTYCHIEPVIEHAPSAGADVSHLQPGTVPKGR